MHVPWRKRISRVIRGELRARVLSRHGEGILANTRNGLLIVDPRDFGVSRSLLTRGAYDWTAIEWLCGILTNKSRIVFVGAHIGALLVPIALKSGSRDVVAFEPSPTNHRLLHMNLALNGLQAIEVHRVAASNAPGTVRFAHNPINSGNSRISAAGDIEVEVRRLDDVLEGSPGIDMLVMDTEGFEVHAMRGAGATLGKTGYFYVEYAPDQMAEQGSRADEFIDAVAERFSSMYLPGEPVRFFPDKSFVAYLRELPQRRALLLNLLFANDASPRPELLGKA
jgi:FkbM family methyltransferase